MSIEDQNEIDVVKLVEHKPLNLVESFKESEIPLFVKFCKNITLKKFQSRG